ncbi:insulin-like receptor [Uranotaenia lowii]|uniref:insulin-like receptor n=1 Tax=Uranotaenia lowii TaxID=190385 RepID=UPI00247A4FF3|nr:insulin-like receptor [Uranotaenia lowii]
MWEESHQLQKLPNIKILSAPGSCQLKMYLWFQISKECVLSTIPYLEIGLSSLVRIENGGVRIEKNPKLCFAETINWHDILSDKGDVFIRDNQKENGCPTCPNETAIRLPNGTSRLQKCPTYKNKPLCWSVDHCQNACPDSCPNSCDPVSGTCCDESCLACGGTIPLNSTCSVCQKYSINPAGNRKCVVTCPSNMYTHHFRCITADECYALKRPISLDANEQLPPFPFIPHNGICSMDCPPDHDKTLVNGRVQCSSCGVGSCPKKCSGGNIDSRMSIQALKGCEIIDGSLEIQLRSREGELIVKELEHLSSIRVITGYLKVVRSYPLLSLGFLKNLETIQGNKNVSNFTVYVYENQNLQELFGRNVSVENGRMFFHNNPVLCTSKIKVLIDYNPLIQIENKENLGLNNGDRAACNVSPIETSLKSVSSETAIVQWAPFKMEDSRQLLGYVIYYIKAPFKNVTFFDGRDACNSQGWELDDVSDFNPDNNTSKILTQLKPFTQYAYYIKTYTLQTLDGRGGQSKISYFTTAPGMPTGVRDVRATVINGTLTISWKEPADLKGILKDYEIYAEINEDDKDLLKQRNFCEQEIDRGRSDPLGPSQPTTPIAPKLPSSSSSSDQCDAEQCSQFCPEKARGESFDVNEAEHQINFEDQLHNYVYIKNPSWDKGSTRKKREMPPVNGNGNIFPNLVPGAPGSDPSQDRRPKMDPGSQFYLNLYNTTYHTNITFPLSYFKHYSLYIFKIRACRQPAEIPSASVKVVDFEPNCSNDFILNHMTPKKEGADVIPPDSIHVKESSNHTNRGIRVEWRRPLISNGQIVTYSVRYQRRDQENVLPTTRCITDLRFNQLGFMQLSNLEPGNYSVTIMATTVAGDGPWSAPRFVSITVEDYTGLYIGLVFAVFALLFIVLVIIGYWYKYQNKGIIINPDVNPDYAGVVYRIDEWEIEREHIIKLEELGQGSFGMVYKGILTEINTKRTIPCAIKTVNENATIKERDAFLTEASVMKQFNTHHVVRLLGVVSQGEPTMVVMELMTNGDLKSYLRRHRPDYENGNDPSPQPPTLRQIYQMAIEIADGMAYLSAKKFVHRDLAARNCMVAEDMTVKIGDFGMTRDIYETDYYRKGTKGFLPVRWMAPESLKDGVFSSSSDVFSYGVVLWEMATLASQPYQGLTNDQVLRYVIDGGVMERPENCPDKLYDMMRRCWQHRPTARPTFLDIINMLLPDANDRFLEVAYFCSQEALDMAPQHHQIIMDDVTTPLHPSGSGHDDDDEDEEDVDKDDEEMRVGDVGTDDEFSMEMTNSHLVPNNGPMATIRSPHSPLSEQLGNRLICDSLAISYHSRDIDDTIAEEEEPEEGDGDGGDRDEDEEEEDAGAYCSASSAGSNSGHPAGHVVLVMVEQEKNESGLGQGQAAFRGSDDQRERSLSKAGTDLGDRSTYRGNSRNRELMNDGSNSINSSSRSRTKSRSVSPGYAGSSYGGPARSTSSSSSSRMSGCQQRRPHSGSPPTTHDYVNSAPEGSSAFGSIPALPPPPQKQFFNRQQQQPPLIDIDSDPYGKEFDAIGTDSSRISAVVTTVTPGSSSRINGRVVPTSQQQQQREQRSNQGANKESGTALPPRLRNGFVDHAAAWPQTLGPTGEILREYT